MRNLLLSLILANLLVLAWQFWVAPSSLPESGSNGEGLALFGAGQSQASATAARQSAPPAPSGPASAALPAGGCFRLGPLPDSTAAQQAARRLGARGIDATPIARDAQLWLGHWVQVAGFPSVPAAEAARERLMSGGIPDALLMQDGPQPMISLGVFRDRSRAERVASAARALGFEVGMRDRYRPGVEQWLLVRPRAGQSLGRADVNFPGDRIMRAEPAPCDDPGPPEAPGGPAAGVAGGSAAVPSATN